MLYEVITDRDKESPVSSEMKLMFLTKFVFSALIDADRTDSRLFEENKDIIPVIDSTELFASYYNKLMQKIDSFTDQRDSESTINHRITSYNVCYTKLLRRVEGSRL